MPYSSAMDVLVEMTPGAGWLAREKQRVVFLPRDESIDVAHDVIEPLLLPRDLDESFATLGEWFKTDRPLPPLLLIALEPSVRMMSNLSDGVEVVDATASSSKIARFDNPSEVRNVGEAASIAFGDLNVEASGMLVEGVVRAGGLRVHLHRGWGTVGPPNTKAFEKTSALSLEIEGDTIVVGTGLVLGRWPYSHPDFDPELEPVVVSDPAVSRLHAEIRPTAEGATLFDRGSHNGTWVVHTEQGRTSKADEGTPIEVRAGDQIRLGDTLIQVRQ